CVLCFAPTILCCARCFGAYYCSAEHFRRGHARHPMQQVLGILAHPSMSASRTPDLLFRVADGHPGLPQQIRVPISNTAQHGITGWPIPRLRDFFGHSCGRMILQFGHNMRFLTSPFHMFYCIDSYASDTHHNRAIEALTAGARPKPRPWPGTVLVLKLTSHTSREYMDIGLHDLPDIREYF
ncbi:hypothetical protein C8Q76DRAFT_586592, partial [Earliella scabrosa]